jgi:hypothetical protein
MTSEAVWSLNARVRASSVAVSRSRLPSNADRRTSDESSSAVRDRREADLDRDDELGRAQRQGQREVLRHELADDHRQQGGHDDGDDRAADHDDRLGHADPEEGRCQQAGDRRLHRVAGQQRGQRDAELGAGEVRRGDAEGADGGREPLLARRLTGLEVGAVEVDQRELAGDEEAGADRQHDADREQDPLVHEVGAPPSVSR